ncbi:MAG: thiamine phosphate synthase [Solirubrobacteraceae bacterium]
MRGASLYLVCDVRQLLRVLEGALAGGVDMVQIRDKQAPREEILEAAALARPLCRAHDAPLLINDDPELAVAAGADGVHVGQDDVSPAQARAIVGPSAIVGLSTHTRAQIDDIGDDLDYIAVGPVFATPTKAGRAAVGIELVRYAEAHARVPFFAIGGIDAANAARVGAQRIAVVRAIADAPDPRAAAAALAGARVGAA